MTDLDVILLSMMTMYELMHVFLNNVKFDL